MTSRREAEPIDAEPLPPFKPVVGWINAVFPLPGMRPRENGLGPPRDDWDYVNTVTGFTDDGRVILDLGNTLLADEPEFLCSPDGIWLHAPTAAASSMRKARRTSLGAWRREAGFEISGGSSLGHPGREGLSAGF